MRNYSAVEIISIRSRLRERHGVLINRPNDPFLQNLRGAVGAFGDAIEKNAETVPVIVFGVQVSAQTTYAVDEAGLGDHPAAQIAAAESLGQRAVLAGDGQRRHPRLGILAEIIVGQYADHQMRADRVIFG